MRQQHSSGSSFTASTCSSERRAAAHGRDCEAEPTATRCTHCHFVRRHETAQSALRSRSRSRSSCIQDSSGADDSPTPATRARERHTMRDRATSVQCEPNERQIITASCSRRNAAQQPLPPSTADDRDSRFRSANRNNAATGKHWKCGLAAAAEDGRAASKHAKRRGRETIAS